MKNCRLFNGDCFDLFAKLKDKSIDMVLVDPPYGTTSCKWDSVIPLEPMWRELDRVVKPDGVMVFMAGQPFTSILVMSNINMFRYSWVWHKNKSGNVFQYKNSPMKRHEDILVFHCLGIAANCETKYSPMLSKCSRIVKTSYANPDGDYVQGVNKTSPYKMTSTGYPESVLCFDVDKGRVHPTQKPVALMEYLIRTYTKVGDVVLDFAMGSGTTGVACMNLGRRFVGGDSDTEFGYFDMAKARMQAAVQKRKASFGMNE